MAASIGANGRPFRKTISADRLRELIAYDPETGAFTWLQDRGGRRCKGWTTRGTPDTAGYLMLRVDYHIYKAHRLAWLYMTGEWPAHIIDHVNGDKTDNRWSNLRQADSAQNAWNTRRTVLSKTGHRGVKFRKSRGKYQAQITVGGRFKYLGLFDTAEEAAEAYAEAAKAEHGAFTPAEPKS